MFNIHSFTHFCYGFLQNKITGKNQESKLEIAFGEEMTADLHSSTEELSFQENDETKENRRKKSSQMVRV